MELDLPQVADGRVLPGEGVIEGQPEFGKATEAIPALHALVTATKAGQVRSLALNIREEPLRIPEGTKFGTFHRTCSMQEEDNLPWRVAVVARGGGGAELMLQKKLREAIEKARHACRHEEGD